MYFLPKEKEKKKKPLKLSTSTTRNKPGRLQSPVERGPRCVPRYSLLLIGLSSGCARPIVANSVRSPPQRDYSSQELREAGDSEIISWLAAHGPGKFLLLTLPIGFRFPDSLLAQICSGDLLGFWLGLGRCPRRDLGDTYHSLGLT